MTARGEWPAPPELRPPVEMHVLLDRIAGPDLVAQGDAIAPTITLMLPEGLPSHVQLRGTWIAIRQARPDGRNVGGDRVSGCDSMVVAISHERYQFAAA